MLLGAHSFKLKLGPGKKRPPKNPKAAVSVCATESAWPMDAWRQASRGHVLR